MSKPTKPGHDRGQQGLAALISMLMVAGVAGFVGVLGLGGGVALAAGATAKVSIGTTLSPNSLTVAPGTTITWTSADLGKHRVRTLAGAPVELDSGGALKGSGSWSFTFTKAGTYPYVDDEHKDSAALHGSITVAVGAVAPKPGAGGPAAPTTAAVHLAGKAFSPSSVSVAIGGVVTWTNNDSMPHNVTSNTGAFTSTTLSPGAVFTFTFTKAGTYAYTCTFHGGMSGTVTVPTATGSVPPAAPPARPVARGRTPVPVDVPAAPGKPGKHIVTITDAGFTPATLTAHAGDTVTWTNVGKMPHTATAAGSAFDLPIGPGAKGSTVLQAPGTIHYVCTYHSYMSATIVVSAALSGVVIAPAAKPGLATAPPAGSSGTAPVAGGLAKTYEIKVNEMTFAPAMQNARVGDTISWVNVGQIPHTVTAKDGSFDRTPIAPGQRFNYMLRKEGSISYVCSYHPGMGGMLMVGPALAGVKVPAVATAADSVKAPAAPHVKLAGLPLTSKAVPAVVIAALAIGFLLIMLLSRAGAAAPAVSGETPSSQRNGPPDPS